MLDLKFTRTFHQAAAKDFLLHSLAGGSFPQALLIHGPAGVGQTALVIDLAQMLLCDSKVTKPCGTCIRCLEWQRMNRDNLHYLVPSSDAQQKNRDSRIDTGSSRWKMLLEDPYSGLCSAREHISIGQVRDLTERLGYSEIAARKRVVIIFWAESMLEPAANSLLKLLEEPPPHTFFLLSCEHKAGMIPTILSRCVLLNLAPLSHSSMEEFLLTKGADSKFTHSKDLLFLCNGSPGTYLELVNHEGTAMLALAKSFMQHTLQGDWFALSELIDRDSSFDDMEKSLKMLNLTLEIIRVGLSSAHRSVNKGNEAAMWSLDGKSTGDMNHVIDLVHNYPGIDQYVNYIEDSISAVRHYAKPSHALLGNFLALETAER
ncbi:hypothetical protein ACFL5V_09650 [Fibrobacterota bacterium]